ncbi:MAG: hypothetical protein WBN92_02280 [Terriglobia bacterium]
MFDEFSRLLIERPELDQMIFGKHQTAEIDAMQQVRTNWAIAIRFDWFESIVVQEKKYNAIPKSIFDHWLSVLQNEMTLPAMRRYWEKCGKFYHPVLQHEVTRILGIEGQSIGSNQGKSL